MLAVHTQIDVARARPCQPVDRDLAEHPSAVVECEEINGVGDAGRIEPTRRGRRHRDGKSPGKDVEEVDEVHATLEQGAIRHRRTPRHLLLPRGEIHELRAVQQDRSADIGS